MAFSVSENSATIGSTEWFLASNSATATAQTTDCVLDVVIDLSALAAGDQFRIRVYEKTSTGATMKALYDATIPGPTTQALWTLPKRQTMVNGWEVSITKVAGTDRVIPWSIRLQTPDSVDTSALTTIQADLDDIQARLPAALVGGRMDSSVGAMAANTVTASAIAADAIGASELAADAITEIQSGLATSANQTTILANIAALPSAAAVATAVVSYAHETGRTLLGLFRRLDALMVGKATGLLGTIATFYRADGTTKAIEATQDTTAGTRTAASTVGGD